jgi:O-antigen/teichoic acid export membrane protein
LTFKTFHTDVLWFVSAGLVLIFLAFLHFMLVIGEQKTLFFMIGYIGNGLSAIFFVLFLSIAASPNFILLLVLVVIQTILFVLLQRKTQNANKAL